MQPRRFLDSESVHRLWKRPAASGWRAGVSLHSHTLHSRESLDFVLRVVAELRACWNARRYRRNSGARRARAPVVATIRVKLESGLSGGLFRGVVFRFGSRIPVARRYAVGIHGGMIISVGLSVVSLLSIGV